LLFILVVLQKEFYNGWGFKKKYLWIADQHLGAILMIPAVTQGSYYLFLSIYCSTWFSLQQSAQPFT
jgi:hypothetical protein